MREDILKEINYIKMSRNIKPNFSALAEEFHASRNTVKKYFYMNEGETPKKKRIYKSIYDSYEDFVRERAISVPGCTYAALFMILKDRHPNELGKAKYGAFTAFCRRKRGSYWTKPAGRPMCCSRRLQDISSRSTGRRTSRSIPSRERKCISTSSLQRSSHQDTMCSSIPSERRGATSSDA